jgi:hypothetical protein
LKFLYEFAATAVGTSNRRHYCYRLSEGSKIQIISLRGFPYRRSER